jgi:L-rhamnonate dehydratase
MKITQVEAFVLDTGKDYPDDCVPHAWLTDLLKAASLHLNAYLMESLYLEYNVSSGSLLNNLCQQKIGLQDGFILVPEDPGLGVEVDESVVAKFRVA